MEDFRQRIKVDYDRSGVTEARKDINRYSRESRNATEKVSVRFSKIADAIKGSLADVAVSVVQNLVSVLSRVSVELFEIGSAVGETESKFNTVFGKAAADVDRFIESFKGIAGLTRTEARDFLAVIGSIAQGVGATAEESAVLSQRVVKLAGDLASFNNLPIEQTFQAIRSGLVGETEPLKNLGIVISSVETDLKALAETGKKNAKELTNLEKAQARLNLIYEQAGVQVGDLERTQDSAANQVRSLSAAVREQREEFAAKLIPVYEELIQYGTELADSYSEAGESLGGKLGVALKDVVRDVITFAKQVEISIRVVKDFASQFEGVFGSGADSLSFLEQLTTELGKISLFIIDIQKGFEALKAASAAGNRRIAEALGFDDRAADSADVQARAEARLRALDAEAERIKNLVQSQRELNAVRDQQAEIEKRVAAIASGEESLSPAEIKAVSDEFREQARAGDDMADTYIKAAKELRALLEVSKTTTSELDKQSKGVRKVIQDLKRVTSESVQLDPENDLVRGAKEAIEEFDSALRELNTRFSEGAISQKEYFQAAANESADFLEKMKLLRSVLQKQGLFSDDLAKAFEKIFKDAADKIRQYTDDIEDDLEDVDEAARKAAEQSAKQLTELSNLLSGLGRFGEELGFLDEKAVKLASSLAGVVEAAANLKSIQASDLSGLARTLGLATGAIGIGVAGASLVSNFAESLNAEREERRRQVEALANLQDQLRENELAIARNTEALLTGARVGQNVSAEQVSEAGGFISSFVSEFGDALRGQQRGRGGSNDDALIEGFRDFLIELEGLDIDGLNVGAFAQQLEAGLAAGQRPDALIRDLITQIEDVIGSLDDGLGGFGDSVAGAVEQARFFAQFLGETGTQQLRRFTDFLLGSVDGLSPAFRSLLESVNDLDVGTEAGRDALNGIIQDIASQIADGSFDLAGLTSGEIELILEQFQSILSGIGDGFQNAADQSSASLADLFNDLRIFSKFLSDDIPSQFALITGRLQDIVGDADSDIAKLIRNLGNVDITSDAGRQQLNAIVIAVAKLLQDGNVDGFDAGELEALLDQLIRLSDGIPVEGVDPDNEFTKSVQIARSITEIQAVEVIALLETQLFVLEDIRDILSGSESLRGIGSGDGSSVNVRIGDVNAGVGDIPGIMIAIEDELRRKTRGGI